MITKRHTYAIYHTAESDGDDVCIKDDIGRFALIPVDYLEEFVEDLVMFMNQRWEKASVTTPFNKL